MSSSRLLLSCYVAADERRGSVAERSLPRVGAPVLEVSQDDVLGDQTALEALARFGDVNHFATSGLNPKRS